MQYTLRAALLRDFKYFHYIIFIGRLKAHEQAQTETRYININTHLDILATLFVGNETPTA